MTEICIRRLLIAAEHEQAVEVQKSYWGKDAGNLVPRHVLHSISVYGGHVLGAYDGQKLIGFVMGFIGTDIDVDDRDARPAMANLLIMSKRDGRPATVPRAKYRLSSENGPARYCDETSDSFGHVDGRSAHGAQRAPKYSKVGSRHSALCGQLLRFGGSG